MRLRRHMLVERIAGINRNIDKLSAKVELAGHDVLVLRRKIDNQEILRDEIGQEQEEEEEAIEKLKENLEEMIREKGEREARMLPGRNWLKKLWRSAVLNAFPSQRNCVQRNLQMRDILEGERPTFGELDLPIGSEESRKEEEEQERLQRQMEEDLENRQETESELLKSWVEEDTKLRCLNDIFSQHFYPQWIGLVELRDREILRLNEITGDF